MVMRLRRAGGGGAEGAVKGFAAETELLDVVVTDGALDVCEGLRDLHVLPFEDLPRDNGEAVVPEKLLEMVLKDAPEVDEFAVGIVEDFGLGWILREEDPCGTAEGFTVTNVILRQHLYYTFGQTALAAQVI